METKDLNKYKPTPQEISADIAKWAETMTKWLIRRKSKKYWQIVSFRGLKGGESTGIVDAIAIRKDHKSNSKTFKRGDHFEIVMIQIKGAGGRRPSEPSKEDNKCPRLVSTTMQSTAYCPSGKKRSC